MWNDWHRRDLFQHASTGLFAASLAWLLERDGELEAAPQQGARAKQAIHIFSPGGVSHIDTFDYKPELKKRDGQPIGAGTKVDTFFGKPGNLLRNLWEFHQRGESGLWVSDLFPKIAEIADELTVIRSMITKSSSHTPACFQMNTGFTMNGYPCVGSWLSYGLGSLNQELPAFVILPDPRGLPNGGTNNWSQGFLPAQHQGVALQTDQPEAIPNLRTPEGTSPEARLASRKFLERRNLEFAEKFPLDTELRARIESYELAAKMQQRIPQILDFSDETQATLSMYGMDQAELAPHARNFLLARRLIERGVRFVQVYSGASLGGNPRINWDAHENVLENHAVQAKWLDQPAAALLKDLKQRGLLEETVVYWSSEFGRTPVTEGLGTLGRDHHPHAFSVWMAGAGLRPGLAHGVTDDVGYHVVENPCTVYDFHATLLHLLGIDHAQLSYYHNGIQRRLTDVHGHVVQEILS